MWLGDRQKFDSSDAGCDWTSCCWISFMTGPGPVLATDHGVRADDRPQWNESVRIGRDPRIPGQRGVDPAS